MTPLKKYFLLLLITLSPMFALALSCTDSYQCPGDQTCTATAVNPIGICVGDSGGLSAGNSCSASWQCRGEMLCRSGICVDYSQEGGLGRGASCHESWQCRGDLYCRGNVDGRPGICVE